MSEVNIDAAADKREEIGKKVVANPSSLPFDFFKRPSNTTTKLIANSPNNKSAEGRSRWYEYEFKELVFVTYILVTATEYHDYDKFIFEWVAADGETFTKEARFSEKSTFVWINDMVGSIKFKPPSKWLSNPTINSVTISGIPRSDITQFITSIGSIEKLKEQALDICDKAIENAKLKNSEIMSLEEKIASLNIEIQSLDKTKLDTKKDIDVLSQKNNEIITKKSAMEDSLKISNDRLTKIEEDISLKTGDRKNIAHEISEKNIELKSLKENINIFPNEIIGFANQSAKNISLYWKIILIPIIIISLMFILLVFSAADLTTLYTRKNNIDIFSIFLTRIPYVAIATVIVTACYKICRVFVSEMIKINQQKLSLTKVSIIAKDIASASENGLNLNDHELFQLRSHLKMNMLRDHMKEYLSKDFEIPLPENIVSALKTSGLKTLMNGSAFGDVDLGNINEVDPPHSTTL